MEALGRVELPTFGLGNRCSIHLSYRAARRGRRDFSLPQPNSHAEPQVPVPSQTPCLQTSSICEYLRRRTPVPNAQMTRAKVWTRLSSQKHLTSFFYLRKRPIGRLFRLGPKGEAKTGSEQHIVLLVAKHRLTVVPVIEVHIRSQPAIEFGSNAEVEDHFIVAGLV